LLADRQLGRTRISKIIVARFDREKTNENILVTSRRVTLGYCELILDLRDQA
jgi:3-deoxy-D-manno-octulosonic acid (KDO) 8-phosphate synthase